ncbi:MAG: DNA cytosine methyltransferase [Thermoplasmata archaeon]
MLPEPPAAFPKDLRAFLKGETGREPDLPAASLFSGAGVGDWGFRKAGFDFVAFLEKDPKRARVIELNFPESEVVIGPAEEKLDAFVEAASRHGSLRLLSVTPPCAGLSPAGQWKSGSPWSKSPSSEARNLLVFAAAKAVNRLRPVFVFIENVRGFLTRRISVDDGESPMPPLRVFLDRVEGYHAFVDLTQTADYGVPQRRKRFVALFTRKDVFPDNPAKGIFPDRTHDRKGANELERWPWAVDTLADYPLLDGRNRELARDPRDPLHVVPSYTRMRYDWVSRIPPHSGKSAYENAGCEKCGRRDLPPWIARCGRCRAVVRGRPRIYDAPGRVRLIKGQHTSYRRMSSDLPVPTITTNNGHYGGDTKIHPWQNRVLSVREVLDHQTVPRDFNWPTYRGRPWVTLIRESVGESVPPWFTFRIGQRLRDLLRDPVSEHLSVGPRGKILQ